MFNGYITAVKFFFGGLKLYELMAGKNYEVLATLPSLNPAEDLIEKNCWASIMYLQHCTTGR
jgi:hypothetical protein